ncbi:MAG: NAD(P)H-hydrate epimerase [Proteobacteria bacterium]|nr:NAD(P)H-hydrate epimerase [Pseudomonadota bacterium]
MKPTQLILNREQARELDRLSIEQYHIPGIVLMENAGRGTVDYLLSCNIEGKIAICCGKGNNAGDGMVVARYLYNRGYDVGIYLFSNPKEFKGEAKMNYQIIQSMAIPIISNQFPEQPRWLIDAIFGTGLQGIVKEPFLAILKKINISGAEIVSLDIPSGLDCDTGSPLGIAVNANHTVTFVGTKQGFLNPEAQPYLGKVHVVDIETPSLLKQQFERKIP